MRWAMLIISLLASALLVGCSEGEQGGQEGPEERTRIVERTVVVKTVEAPRQAAEEQQAPATQEQQASEPQAPEEILARQYQYINEGNYATAYSLFSEQSQQFVTLEQYIAFFESFDFYQVTSYSFPSVEVQEDEATIDAIFSVSTPTGEEQYQEVQQMELTDNGWRAVMRNDQVQAFVGTDSEPASDIQQPENSNTKQVTVEISSDVPVDISILDDNFDVGITEEITGSETYEFEIAADSGLTVGASNEDLVSGNINISVYENGELVAEDNSSQGYAQVMY